MDKGSNISFPLDSGSTVYNGSGISVGGKASTDILHAAGGTTKIKTLNGESMLGEGNIVIDPSSVPVSLSWYNRTSSQQDATINLTIGDTTVNLFPNIFKLFKAGKVSTSESLSIELTANPGVSGVPQVPTSLCQWSIPLADSNTAGIISSEDKAKLDNLSDPKNLLAYGVEWDSTNSSPVLTRIGNMSLHKSLPIQSALRGCVCQGKRIMYYLDPNDWSKKADGTDSRLDGYDGTVQVEVPEFYLWSETEGTKSRVYVSTQKTEANAITISAYGASLVAVNSRRGSSIVHEAEHIKNHIWQYIGYTPQRDNDEVDAYLLTYIYDKITQVFYKHKDNKE